MGTSAFFKVIATYADGSTDNITAEVEYNSSNDVCDVLKGCIRGVFEGSATIAATYKNLSTTASVDVESFFPLTNAGFNPNIYSKGTFDETTGNLVTGKYGFGGWRYTNGIDISDYKYLVVELNKVQEAGAASFRLFDQNRLLVNSSSMNDIGNPTRLVIDLHNQTK